MSIFPDIRFLRAFNGQNIEYKTAKDLYKNSTELHQYFENNYEAWFICDDYPDELTSLFNNFRINQTPKVKKKAADKNGFVIISNHMVVIDGVSKISAPGITVDGLKNALINPTIQKSTFIWNNIAIPHSACICGIVEKIKKTNI